MATIAIVWTDGRITHESFRNIGSALTAVWMFRRSPLVEDCHLATY